MMWFTIEQKYGFLFKGKGRMLKTNLLQKVWWRFTIDIFTNFYLGIQIKGCYNFLSLERSLMKKLITWEI